MVWDASHAWRGNCPRDLERQLLDDLAHDAMGALVLQCFGEGLMDRCEQLPSRVWRGPG